jgi:hypothetical protein
MRLSLLALSLIGGAAAVAVAQTPMDIQPVKELKPTGSLGTCAYKPTGNEEPFYKRLDSDELATGSFMKAYSIHGKTGKYVSWYGIIRGITVSDQRKGEMTLLLEQKFFDGLSDCHIMLVSYSGGGDFRAILTGEPAAISALALVRVYGKVVRETDKIPEIAAEYVRVWPWLTFTFTDLGPEDKGNSLWAKYSHINKGDRIYAPYPDLAYYRRLLGNPGDFGLDWKPQ